ncbi:MAG: hypothetical protein Q7J82_06580 [Coriobacteriia bacterium]|nr:hypothetical protein [Coriobacteriia bacterium]
MTDSVVPGMPVPGPEPIGAEAKRGWFTSLPLWGKILFVLVWPVSLTYAVVVMWKDKRFPIAARVALTALAVIVIAVGFAGGGDESATTAGTTKKADTSAATVSDSTVADVAEPEPKPEPEPEPEPEPTIQELADSAYGVFDVIEKTGTGDDVIPLPAGVSCVIVATHSGSSNFVLRSLDSGNQMVDLLVNEIGAYSGSTFCAEGVSLQVEASGSWTIRIAPISTVPVMATEPLSSKGDAVMLYDGGTAIWDITHTGSSNFVVKNGDGLLVNEIGDYSGAVPVSGGPYIVTISADGAWTITIR